MIMANRGRSRRHNFAESEIVLPLAVDQSAGKD